jgi:hypothetical protein
VAPVLDRRALRLFTGPCFSLPVKPTF